MVNATKCLCYRLLDLKSKIHESPSFMTRLLAEYMDYFYAKSIIFIYYASNDFVAMSSKQENFSLKSLKLLCEWETCEKEVVEMIDFVDHISKEHLVFINEDDLTCQWRDCEALTVSLSELRRHILLHAFHTKIKYQGQIIQSCRKLPNCTIGNKSRNVIPELPESLVCCWENCLEEFECPEYFYRHVDCHSDYDTKEKGICCLWNGCNRKLPDKFKLKEHFRSHTQEKIVACPTCGGMFASRTKFFDHIQRQLPIDESERDTYICDYCSKRWNSKRLLRDHMKTHVNHYKCPYCDMTCATPSSIRLHVLYRHSDEKPLACSQCEYRCKTESDLGKHLESHISVPNYQCSVEGCNFASRYRGALKSHFSKVHESKELPKYSCHLCDKVCTRGNYLTKHLLNHHKFKWPSGHCKFRYKMEEDGFYRLETVRYESLELTEMMEESSENIDDPSLPAEMQTNDGNQTTTYNDSGDTAFNSSEPFVGSNILSSNDSLLLYLQKKTEAALQQNTHSMDSTEFSSLDCQAVEMHDPVLINIVDAEGLTSESGCNVMLVKTTKPVPCDQIRSVQLVTEDEHGNVVVETAEIISQA